MVVQKAWDEIRDEILRAVPSALRLVCESRPRWMREGEDEEDFRECAAYEIAWVEASPAQYNRAGLDAILEEHRRVWLGLDPGDAGISEGEDVEF